MMFFCECWPSRIEPVPQNSPTTLSRITAPHNCHPQPSELKANAVEGPRGSRYLNIVEYFHHGLRDFGNCFFELASRLSLLLKVRLNPRTN